MVVGATPPRGGEVSSDTQGVPTARGEPRPGTEPTPPPEEGVAGDGLEYQQFRQLVRDAGWQRQFLAKPLAERRRMAAGLRETSRQRTAHKALDIMDVNQDAVLSALREHRVRRLIHGHTHRPATHELTVDGTAATRIVLGDWYEQGSVLWCDPTGCRLQGLALN